MDERETNGNAPETEPEWTYNKLELQGNVAVLTSMTRANRHARVRRLDKDTYRDEATGEVREYQHRDNRSQNRNSLLRTFAKIRGIVNANSEYPPSVKFITLTYAENMTDPERLYKDFKAFWQRFKRWAKRNGQKQPEYLMVVEPQQRGAWHGHLLLFYGDERAPFIPHGELCGLWGNGGVWITNVDDVDNIGAYLSAYLTDAVVDAEPEDDETKTVNGEKKSVIKGGRLHMYPTGMNIYRCSRGIKRPKVIVLHSDYAEQWREEHDATYSLETSLEDPVTGFETRIRKEWYNKTKEGL